MSDTPRRVSVWVNYYSGDETMLLAAGFRGMSETFTAASDVYKQLSEPFQESCRKLVREHHLAEDTLTEKQLAEAIRQMIACGDVRKNVVVNNGGQSVIWMHGYGMDSLQTKYNELIYAVERKHDGESRHETALRYIREAEKQDNQPQQEAR